jgi:hypothetical protein
MTSFTVKESTSSAKKFVGVWEYNVPDAPYPYQTGTMTFSNVKKKISGFISIEGNTIDMEKVVSKKNNLTYEIYIEGETVIFNLTFKKKSFSGTASYSQGDLEITGTKKE